MPLNDPPPADVQDAVRGRHPDVRFLYAARSDLDRARRFAPSWLIVLDAKPQAAAEPAASGVPADLRAGDARVLVVEDGSIAVDLPLACCDEFRVEERLGGGSLLARLKIPPPDGAAAEAMRRASGQTGSDAPPEAIPRAANRAPQAEERRLAWFTKISAPDMGVFARVLNDLLGGRTPGLPEPEGEVACPRCGRPLEERGANCPYCVNVLRVFARLLGFLAPYRARLAAMIAATLAGVVAQAVVPYATLRITDDVVINRREEVLPGWIGLMLASATAVFGARWLGQYLASWLSSRMIADLRTRLHAHIQRLRLGYFHKREAGELTSRVMHDTQELQTFLIDGLPYILVNALLFVVVAAILVAIDPWLSVCVFAPVPVMLWGIRWIWQRLHSLFHKDGSLHGRLYSILGESVRGVKAVKAASREDDRSGVFAAVNRDIVATVVRIDRQYAAFSEGSAWVFAVAGAGVYYFAARRIDPTPGAAGLTLGDLVAYVGYMGMFYGPLTWFSVIANWMNHALASAERIFAVLDTPEEIYDAPDAADPPRLAGCVEFDHVRFSYDRGKEVIKDVCLDVGAGEMVGLVGKSGAGKSTVVNLLCRFYEVDAGEIRIDGRPIRGFRLDGLRRQIGFVMQDPFLFRASLLENIRYGTPGASLADVVRAAKAAHAHDFIVDKEFGYDTIVGDGGVDLSGGEKQRIAIARALLHDPPILILDEATSSVDGETEKRIQDALARLVKGRTVIAIAHRLATLRNARRLVVMEEGRVAEIGTHDELTAAGGIYAGLVKTQTELNRLRDEQQVW